MRKKIRGLRGIERSVLKRRRDATAELTEIQSSPSVRQAEASDAGGEVVLDYCAVVRGVLNDDQGGPLHPPGLRMTEALGDVRASLDRSLAAKKGGSRRRN